MSFRLEHLPARTAGAAENMAIDFLLLQQCGDEGVFYFRHYGWRGEVFTFGYSQKVAAVREQMPPGDFELCRRPTGGGVVDHRDDWTYALLIPRGHDLYRQRAAGSYREAHAILAGVLARQGAAVRLHDPCGEEGCREKPSLPGVCFAAPEPFDVVEESSGRKAAGAAQKRSRRGLLLQGSVSRAVLPGIDWDRLEEDFAAALGERIGLAVSAVSGPEIDPEVESALIDQFASPEWTERR